MQNCNKCGREFCDDELFLINGELMCAECAEAAGYAQCQDCGEWFKADEEGYEYCGEPLCESCFEENYTTCENCGEIILMDDSYLVHGRHCDMYVCEDCIDGYFQCIDCGEYYTRSRVYIDSNNLALCDDCYTYHDWSTCADCGRFVRNDEVEEGDNGDWYCPDCIDDHRSNEDEFTTHIDDPGSYDNGEAIHNYGFKPRAVICSRANERSMEFKWGVEDEVDSRNPEMRDKARPTAEAIKELTDRVYMKHDGSLCYGFEIVSHPGTLAHHMYEMPWRGICSKALKAGFRSHDAGSCGLHIHCGRQELGTTDEERNRTIRKVVVLMNRYWQEITRFTRRSEDRLQQWASLNYVSGYNPSVHIDDAWAEARIPVCNSHESRYHAINCENEATIEFRIFRGTLKRDTLIASLQLCWNICGYAMTHDWNEIQSGTWLDVARYKRWNELDAYLTLRGLAPEVPPVQNTSRTPNFGGADGIRGDE